MTPETTIPRELAESSAMRPRVGAPRGFGPAGVACTPFVAASLVVGHAASVRPPWVRLVVGVAASKVAAIDLFVRGWTVRG